MTRQERHITVVITYDDGPAGNWVDVNVKTDIAALTPDDIREVSDAVARIIGRRTGVALTSIEPRAGYG